MSGEIQARNEMFSAMYGGKPFKTYKKTILGKVHINIWDNFEDKPVMILLEGDPNKNDPDCFINLWSEKDDVFFRKAPYNRRHLKEGRIIEIQVEEPKAQEKTIESSTDEELEKLVNSPFLALQNALNKTESEALLFRILNIAHRLEKSDKLVRAIESRLSEVQEQKFANNLVVER